MGKFINNLIKISKVEKIKCILLLNIAFIVIALSTIGLLDIIPMSFTNAISMPLIGVTILINGTSTYKKDRKAGIMWFIGAAFIFICSLMVLYINILINKI